MKELIIKKWGTGQLKDRIFATTDKAKGALKSEANVEGYKTFVIPDDIGGRFSVITPVGLFPIACAGIDIRSFVKGLVDGEKITVTMIGTRTWLINMEPIVIC